MGRTGTPGCRFCSYAGDDSASYAIELDRRHVKQYPKCDSARVSGDNVAAQSDNRAVYYLLGVAMRPLRAPRLRILDRSAGLWQSAAAHSNQGDSDGAELSEP